MASTQLQLRQQLLVLLLVLAIVCSAGATTRYSSLQQQDMEKERLQQLLEQQQPQPRHRRSLLQQSSASRRHRRLQQQQQQQQQRQQQLLQRRELMQSRRRELHDEPLLPARRPLVKLQPSQLAALKRIREVMQVGSWSDTNTGPTCNGNFANWPGVGCDAEGMVVELRMGHFTAEGTIPVDLSRLTRLRIFDFHYNDVRGNIPPAALSTLKNLTDIDGAYNYLNETLPFEAMAKLSQLTFLNFSRNALLNQDFTSNLPYMPQLKVLNIGGRAVAAGPLNITGKLEYFLNSLPNITFLDLDELLVTGSIPSDIGTSNRHLEYLNLESLDLDPVIPSSLWTLTKLSYLNLQKPKWNGDSNNNETELSDGVMGYQGPVPDAIGSLTNLEFLALSHVKNSPVTPAPASFSRLTRLTSLSLISCSMYTFPNVFNATGLVDLNLDYTPINITTTPPGLSKLTNLLTLTLSNTNITQIPALSTLTKLVSLNLAGMNHLELALDSLTWLTSLNFLSYLNIGDALNLYGQLPYDLSKLTSLKQLLLPNTKFQVFPYPIFLLSNLEQLELSRSQMNMSALPLELSNLNKLTSLLMQDVGLPGTIPSTLGNLTGLLDLDLSNNHLQGPFPTSFNNATLLQTLQLDGNKLEGRLPNVTGFPALMLLSLSNNNFTGGIPTSFQFLSVLSSLDLSWNNLTGVIPEELGYCMALQTLNLAGNKFSGGLNNLQYISGLTSLILDYIPLSVAAFNQVSTLTSLAGLTARGIGLTGTFPNAVLQLPYLDLLDLSVNNLTGALPTNTGNLTVVDLSSNNFTGTIPAALVNRLDQLSVASNNLNGALPAISSNSPLEQLNVDRNKLTGPLPDFSTWPDTITIVYMSNNEFSGSIPDSISHLKNLNSLFLNNNTVTGSLPSAMSTLTALQTLWLQDNDIDGILPDFLSGMADLRVLVLDRNRLTGTIPQSFCNFTNLQYLGLSANMMYGELPQSNNKPCFAGMDTLNSLDLSNNSFTGRIDYNFEGMNPKKGGTLNVAYNYFFGSNELQGGGVIYCPAEVPPYVLGADGSFAPPVSEDTNLVSNLNRDQQLNTVEPYQSGSASLANNCFQTVESDKCPSLKNQTQRTPPQCFAFCGLQVNAEQPVYCANHGDCVPVTGSPGTFNCSCEAGYVVSYVNGSATCIEPPPTPSSGLSTGAIVGIVLGCLVAVAIIIFVLYLLLKPEKEDEGIDLGVCKKYSLADVEAATNNWDKTNCLGEGAYGLVYRGTSSTGEMWAVKRAKLFTNDFENEVRAVASLKHPNLVRLLGYCLNFNSSTGKQEQILMYEFVSNGDLSKHLFGKKEDPLTLQQRLDIATGMAKGLAYLHGFPEPIVHRDIKTENVLLDEKKQAKIADFGLLKKLDECEAENQSRVAGTPGYVDPEYNRSEKVSSKSDVYSFGIVLLEMISGRRAIESNRAHISQWAYAMVQANNVDELRDKRMTGASDDMILDLADVAFDCLKRPRTRRPNMDAVRIRLENIRAAYMSGSSTFSGGAIDSYSVRDSGPSSTSDGPLIEEPMSTADLGTTSQSHIGNWNAQPAPR